METFKFILSVLLLWTIISVPAGLFIGAMIRKGKGK